MITKFATLEVAEVLEIKGAPTRQRTASLDKIADFENYRTSDGYLYARIRAISSRVNKNSDGWPSIELAGSKEIFDRHHSGSGFTVEAAEGDHEKGFSTFVGKPIFVDHHNSDPKKARGVIVDAKLNVLDHRTAAADDDYWGGSDVDSEHMPATEVELLLEVDADSFPKLAQSIVSGDLDGFSMGCDVEYSKCSHCGHKASSPDEYCSHIVMKGAHHDMKTADGKRTSKKSYENCYGVHFFEISAVFDPADETALAREVRHEAATKQAENPLPQSFETHAPDEVDTLRQEKLCPICGNDMRDETCEVCGYVEPPKEFDNPDLNKADEIRQDMKQKDEQAAGASQDSSQPGQPQGGPLTGPATQSPTKPPQTASVKSDMSGLAPLVTPKTAARINSVENSVTPSNPIQTNEPKKEIVTSDQTRPVTSAMLTAQNLMATAQRNHTGVNMNRTADATPPGDTSADARVDVTGVGGVMDASNEQASKAEAQINVQGVGGTGVSDVSADATESLPTADRGSDDAGFNTDHTTEDSGPTKTFGDSDGTEKGVTDPVTSETPYWVDESKWSHQHRAYDDKTLEQNEQQGNQPVAQGGSAVKGVQPVAETFGTRENVLEHKTSPENNSGATKTWSGTDGNSVLKQQDPVTRDKQETGGVPTPDVTLRTNSHFIRALRLAESEEELGLITREEKYARLAQLENESDTSLEAQLGTLSRVKTAGLAKLAQQRQSGVRRLPSAFGKQTAAPNGFKRIASDREAATQQPVDNEMIDSALFMR
jgi:hypothetical protein